jgi:hypothetical protein
MIPCPKTLNKILSLGFLALSWFPNSCIETVLSLCLSLLRFNTPQSIRHHIPRLKSIGFYHMAADGKHGTGQALERYTEYIKPHTSESLILLSKGRTLPLISDMPLSLPLYMGFFSSHTSSLIIHLTNGLAMIHWSGDSSPPCSLFKLAISQLLLSCLHFQGLPANESYQSPAFSGIIVCSGLD